MNAKQVLLAITTAVVFVLALKIIGLIFHLDSLSHNVGAYAGGAVAGVLVGSIISKKKNKKDI